MPGRTAWILLYAVSQLNSTAAARSTCDESGNKAEAEKLLAEPAVQSKNQYGSPYYFAIVYVGLGENEKAMDWFDKAFADRSNGLVFLKVEPELDNLSFQSSVHRVATEAEIPGL